MAITAFEWPLTNGPTIFSTMPYTGARGTNCQFTFYTSFDERCESGFHVDVKNEAGSFVSSLFMGRGWRCCVLFISIRFGWKSEFPLNRIDSNFDAENSHASRCHCCANPKWCNGYSGSHEFNRLQNSMIILNSFRFNFTRFLPLNSDHTECFGWWFILIILRPSLAMSREDEIERKEPRPSSAHSHRFTNETLQFHPDAPLHQ